MKTENGILLHTLSTHYKLEMSFFTHLNEIGLLEIIKIEEALYIPEEQLNTLEKMIRIHHELDVNIEGIDVIFHLLQKIETLQKELVTTKNRLGLYES